MYKNSHCRVLEAGLRLVLKNSLNRLEGEIFDAPKLSYTDDTAMTVQVAKTLINYKPECYQKELALNFVKEYFNSPGRGYGGGVRDLFTQLKRNRFNDILSPAANQFGGTGSFGNGSAMRISPVALYCFNKSEEFLIDLVKKTSEITHSNVVAINGAVLQALAIHRNLKMDPTQTLDKIAYVDALLSHFEKIETGIDDLGIPEEKYFTKQLNEIKQLINKPNEPTEDEVVNTLGHSVNALYSVPTALYSFLKNCHLQTPFRSTLEYSIGLGGDTDTIASMSLALTGSYHGAGVIPPNLLKHCESHEIVLEVAEQLYGAVCE